MSNTAGELKYALECLRLASDFMELSYNTLNPKLRTHYTRMSDYWTERADGRPPRALASALVSAAR